MSKEYRKQLRRRKRRINHRLRDIDWPGQPRPMFSASNIHYEVAGRCRGHGMGGIGAIHLLARRIGLIDRIDEALELLKIHKPYHESDHVLNIAYNSMMGGVRLEDIELRRNDEAYLDGLGAARIPDPTTSGDFTRRFGEAAILKLTEAINLSRLDVWKRQPSGFLQEAYVDVDGTIGETLGECKGGMGLSHKGIWGYHPLIVSLANTREVLFLVNRPGNVVSHKDSVPWIERAIDLLKPVAGKITLRGDTDFTHTGHLDGWDDRGVEFVLGMDAHAKVVDLADSLPEASWEKLERLPRYEIKTEPRTRRSRVKEAIVIQKGYTNKVLVGESVAEIDYRPLKCRKSYRLVIVRKNISVKKGEAVLFDEIRYFFYITNKPAEGFDKTGIVGLANGRCDQENVIEQLKNGINAMRMPVDDLMSNWAYMLMSSLGWNLKAWFGLLVPCRDRGLQIVRMEYRRFLHAIVMLPAQIVRAGRRIVYRLLGWNRWLVDFFATWERLRLLHPG